MIRRLVSNYRYIIFVVALAAGIGVFRRPPLPLKFESFKGADFIGQLAPLFLAALLIERSLEVFISTLRGAGEVKRQAVVDRCKKAADADASKLPALYAAQDELSDYKSSTQQIAMPSAVVLGILVSAVGIRCLGPLLADPTFKDRQAQQPWFTAADVLLTGGLLGGGSDFVHQFITSLTDFVNKPPS